MTITNARIEPNGWVLELTLSGAATGGFANYTLDPNGTPRVTMTSAHPGYDVSGGIAVANAARARNFVATKPLRKTVTVNTAGVVQGTETDAITGRKATIDETDMGGGVIKVRIALSQFVYATDAALSLTTLAGWRTGEGAQTLAVTNNSTLAAPIPIFRWIDVPYQLNRDGQIKLSMIVASHHPNGTKPVAAVKFTITDGTTIKTLWATALTTSTTYGDTTRCYEVVIDATTATALASGLLRCDAEVYPWIGPMRTTDAAGTKPITNLWRDGLNMDAAKPYVVAYEATGGSRYANKFICIDPAATTTPATASTVTVATTWAAAKAGVRAKDLQTALAAAYLQNRTINATPYGGTNAARSIDGFRFGMVAGTHVGTGPGSFSFTTVTNETYYEIFGDPDDSNPRANVIWQTGTNYALFVGRAKISNLTVQAGSTALMNSVYLWWFDNVTLEGKPGQKSASIDLTTTAAPATDMGCFATRSKFWGYGKNWVYNPWHPGVIRGCQVTRRVEGVALISNKWIALDDPDNNLDNNLIAMAAYNNTNNTYTVTIKEPFEDFIVAYNDLRGLYGLCWGPGRATAASAGTTLNSCRRNVYMGNICERVVKTGSVHFYALGENELLEMSYNIVEGNSLIGERATWLYNDPSPATIADTLTQNNLAYGNRHANNVYDLTVEKTDQFTDSPTTSNLAIAAGVALDDPRRYGYRPVLTGTWSYLYGVGCEGNYDFGRYDVSLLSTAYRFHEWFGLRSGQVNLGVNVDVGFTADNSSNGTATGRGNYKPKPTMTTLLGRATSANCDVDLNMVARGATFASGAYEGMAVIALAPAGGTSATRSGSPAVAWLALLAPASARHTGTATSPLADWAAVIVPESTRLAQTATASQANVDLLLHPNSALHVQTDSGPILIPETMARLINTLIVSGELRIVYVPRS